MADRAVDPERLIDLASDLGLVGLEATTEPEPGHWVHTRVQHASLYSDSKTGWDVETTETWL